MKKTMLVLMGMGALNGVMATDSSTNLVYNGDFSQSDCYADWCIYNTANSVRGWCPEPEIEVGYGSVYSNYLTNERVLELAPNVNTCVKQAIKNIEPGCYQLKFEWGARKDRAFSDCQFNVSLGGKALKSITPSDYQIHSETIDVEFSSGCEAELRFCGIGGDNNSYGAFIKSVSLVKKLPNPPVYQIPQYPPITINVPVMNPPTLTPPPIVVPNLPQPVLPQQPYLNLPVISPPTFQFPTINYQHVNPPVIPSPPVITLPPIVFNPIGFYMESHSQQCYNKEYTLEVGGEIEIAFDYKVLTNFMVRDSAVIVSWDGQQVYKVLPCDSGKTIRFKVNTSKGCHKLSFCTAGCPTENLHQDSICNVALYEKQCVGAWGTANLVLNGDFEQNQCSGPWCLWNQSTIQPTSVPGWTPSPEIEVGRGTTYTNVFGTSWVAELDPNANTCIKQNISIQPGQNLLTFDWAARQGVSAQSNQFDVKINGEVLKSFLPANGNLNHESAEFSLNTCPAQSEIAFCGTGNSDSLGAVVDNIKVVSWDKCASYNIVKY